MSEIIDILLIEDDEASAQVIKSMLKEVKGKIFNVTHLTTLEGGIRQLEKKTFNAILLDLNLPGSSDMDTYLQIRTHVSKTPVIIMTSIEDEATAIFLLHKGAQDYLIKKYVNKYHLVRSIIYSIERKQMQQELTEAKEMAEDGKKAQEVFLSNMSHELRTPLNAISGMVQLLQLTELAPNQAQYLKNVNVASEILIGVINDILDFSKIKTGSIEFEKIAFDLPELISGIGKIMAPSANKKGIELLTRIDKNVPQVIIGDKLRLQQILINIIGNAIKFTDKGKVGLTVKIKEDKNESALLAFSVHDSGIGIPQDKIDTIFESFKQADETTCRKYGGTGLGLAIVKSLVEAQQGDVKVMSEINKGSTFTVRLPFIKGKKSFTQKTKPGKKILKALPHIKVLLVEDNDMNQVYMVELFKLWGLEIDCAENGKDALGKVSANHYDMVLMDVRMPEMDGIEATRHIRKMPPEKAAVPILALTASVRQTGLKKCFDAGMNDFISKPVNQNELHSKISRLLNDAELHALNKRNN